MAAFNVKFFTDIRLYFLHGLRSRTFLHEQQVVGKSPMESSMDYITADSFSIAFLRHTSRTIT